MASAPQLLIVDDNPARRIAFRRIAVACAAEVVEARGGAEALALVARQPFAAALLSTTLEEPDAFAVLQQLQRSERSPVLPVVMVGPEIDESERERAYAAGAADYLAAPLLDGLVLQQKLRVFVELHRRQRLLEQALLRLRDDSDALIRQNEHLLTARRDSLRRMTHDALTALPTRELFEDRLGGAIRRSARGRKCFTVATLGLRRVAAIATAEGETAADELRRQIAERLTATLRASDTVARVGTDEFALLIEAIDSPRRATSIGAKLVDALSAPLRLSATDSGKPLMLSPLVSAGFAVYPNDALDAEGLMMLSGLALQRARLLDGSGHCVYADEVDPLRIEEPRPQTAYQRMN